MTQSKSNATVKKKVQPYPFAAEIEMAGKKWPIQVIKLTNKGLIALTGGLILKVGDEHSISFQIPVFGDFVVSAVKIMKTYDQFRDPKKSNVKVERMAEFLFLKLTEEHRKRIDRFTIAIKQD